MNPWQRGRFAALATETEEAISQCQPLLRVAQCEPLIAVEGSFVLFSSDGPFDQWQTRIEIDSRYPRIEPVVFETGDRIPRHIDRHVYPSNGACCTGVWEHWLASAPDLSIRGFLVGPVHEFFLSQWWFERNGKWRFGDWSHGAPGLIVAYAETMGVSSDARVVLAYLELLAQEWPKGHWLCPCGSGVQLRRCHAEQLNEMHSRIPPRLARQMLHRLRVNLAAERPRKPRPRSPS